MRAPVMLVGQAPGLTEYETRRPFSGPAGDGIRTLLAKCGISLADFDRDVYQTSVVKCFPGRKKNKAKWEDRQPIVEMQRNCSGFLERQIMLVQPSLIIAMGGPATDAFDRLTGIRPRNLFDAVGTSTKLKGATIVYLTHTSGSNRSLNASNTNNIAKQARSISIIASEIAAMRGPGRVSL
jgi:uracil-DNA glycosylase family 4